MADRNSQPGCLPMVFGDAVRYLMDLLLHSAAIVPAAFAFWLLWSSGALWARFLAVPAALVALTASFVVAVMLPALPSPSLAT